MAAKIILVQPKNGDWDIAGARPPDSLLAVAALPYKEGYDIKIIDQRIDRNWKSALKAEMAGAILVGTTSMTGPQIKYALEISKFVKENSDLPVVWGGVHASLLPEQTVRNGYIDYVVKGEGDFAFLELIKAIERGAGQREVKGLYYKEAQEIKKTGDRELIRDLDILSDFPYELVNLKNYYGFNPAEGRSITLMTSRGCPYRCAFCYNTIYYKNTWRGMSAKRTFEMIRKVVDDFEVSNIYFEDDNFCANVKRFEEIIGLILKNRLKISWGLLGARTNTLKSMSDTLLSDAVKAGCMNIDVGVESGSERILQLISKDVEIPDLIETNKRLAKYFDKTKYTFIMGTPGETEGELLESVKLAVKLSKENEHALPVFLTYCAYPGTKLYELAINSGFREPKNLDEWADVHYTNVFWRYPWLDKKRIKIIENLGFSSLFANKNNEYKINSTYLKIIARLYRPVARMRFEHNIYQLPFERVVATALLNKLI